MPTRVSVAADLERELLTAEDFLEWLDPDDLPSISASLASLPAAPTRSGPV